MVVDLIREGARRLAGHQGFTTWLAGEQASTGDMAVVNNSFVFRDVKTVKSDRFIAFSDLSQAVLEAHVHQGTDNGRSSIPSASVEQGCPNWRFWISVYRRGGDSAVELGGILLIGEVRDTVILEESVGTSVCGRDHLDCGTGMPSVDNGAVPPGQVHRWRISAAGGDNSFSAAKDLKSRKR